MATILDKPNQLAAAVSAAAILTGLTIYTTFTAHKIATSHSRATISSPRTTLLPQLSKDQIARLPYPPDALPGARDVSTPYGTMRVYEWGPATGRKVVLVHGDATPSPVFKPIADDLVAKGCRVLTFDLWGRGYTDTPSGAQHDSRLYGLQILYALTSSPIAWTGEAANGRFSIVGFSMGATISLDFFAHHPGLVESVVLLGPGGLIRVLPPEYRSFWYRYPSLISKAAIRRLIGVLLGVAMAPVRGASDVKLSDEGFTPAGAVQFQFDHHQGHVESFLSNIQYGPLQNQGRTWKLAGDIIKGAAVGEAATSPLSGSKILIVCGESDDVVIADDVRKDAIKYLNSSAHFDFKLVPGGHGFVWTAGHEVGKEIVEFWGL